VTACGFAGGYPEQYGRDRPPLELQSLREEKRRQESEHPPREPWHARLRREVRRRTGW
jgi:hypothetical protein